MLYAKLVHFYEFLYFFLIKVSVCVCFVRVNCYRCNLHSLVMRVLTCAKNWRDKVIFLTWTKLFLYLLDSAFLEIKYFYRSSKSKSFFVLIFVFLYLIPVNSSLYICSLNVHIMVYTKFAPKVIFLVNMHYETNHCCL